MEMKSLDNCSIITSDSSDDGSSNEDVDEDRSPVPYRSALPSISADSGDEGVGFFAQNNNESNSSPPSVYSQGMSPYSQHSSVLRHSYKPSTSPDPPSNKRKFEQTDSDYCSIDDAASTISSSSSGSTRKKSKKFKVYDQCAQVVEEKFTVAPKAHRMMVSSTHHQLNTIKSYLGMHTLVSLSDDGFLTPEKGLLETKNMGFEEGKGLGRNQQGITAPIQASTQRGRSGIGHAVKQLEPAKLMWDDTYEEVSVEEFPSWLDGYHLPGLSHGKLRDWIKEGPKIMEMDSFSDYCDPELLHDILESKTIFDNLQDRDLMLAVKRSNPFESIASGIFLNRAAMKMANMDRVFDFMFTNPVDDNNRPVIGEMDLLYFADVCAGPGGFSEYVLWRKNWQAKGIGFTLKNDCDFKLDNFIAGTPETFEPFYGAKGDGDVYDPDNIESLTDFVMAKTDHLGVHFMMADGGFSVAGNENIQEIMSKRLYLCQFLVALCIVRTGGHFVCKLFDVFSPFSVGLIYLMYRSFNKICLHKPNSSRPANSERYIICKYKRSDCEDIRHYMFDLNERLHNYGSNSDIDINDCVPMAELRNDHDFYNYVFNSNNKLGRRQLVHLKKVIAFCRDKSLVENKQNDLRQKCLDYWGVPSAARRPDSTSAENMAAQILKNTNYDFAAEPGEDLESEEKLKCQFPSTLDWTCIPVGNHNECHFYIGCRNRVYMLRKNGKGWTTLDSKIKLELSPGTLVYGEVVEEVHGSFRAQSRDKFFHIIDAFALGKKNIMTRSYATRIRLCKLYAKALHKNWQLHANTNSCNSSPLIHPMNLRANDYFDLKHLMTIFHNLEIRMNKMRHQEILLALKDELPKLGRSASDMDEPENYFFPVKGVLFYKITKNPWTVHFSKSRNIIYYYRKDQPSSYDRPSDINASTIDCFVTRKLWTWDQGVGIKGESPKENVLHMNQLLSFIQNSVVTK